MNNVVNNVWAMPELIAFKKGVWSGNPILMEHLQRVTSVCGITRYELYIKTLKEYRKYKSVYDMNHNAPFLLQCRVMALTKTCKMRTVPSTAPDIESIVSGILLPTRGNRYPILAKPLTDTFNTMFDKLVPYMDITLFGSDSTYQVKEKLERHFTISYFSEWQSNIAESKPWIVSCLNHLLSFLPDENKKAGSNILDREAKDMVDTAINVTNTIQSRPRVIRIWQQLFYR